ncbi:MAG: class I SAM-dependent methyltransferase [Patescibacteria group bacterium]
MKNIHFGDKQFDKGYFSGKSACGYPNGYSKQTIKYYNCWTIPEEDSKFINDLKIKTYFEIGCACGYLMEELMKYHIKVKGWDISEYIVNQASPKVKLFIEIKSIDNIISLPDKFYDLVHISGVIGYISIDELDFYLAQIKRIAKKYVIIYAGTPEDAPEENNIRGINQSDEWWKKQYSKYFKEKDLSKDLWEIA